MCLSARYDVRTESAQSFRTRQVSTATPPHEQREPLYRLMGAQGGYQAAVDVDLEKLFDLVTHGILMDRLAKRISDVAVLRLIRGYLYSDEWRGAGVRAENTGRRTSITASDQNATTLWSSFTAWRTGEFGHQQHPIPGQRRRSPQGVFENADCTTLISFSRLVGSGGKYSSPHRDLM